MLVKLEGGYQIFTYSPNQAPQPWGEVIPGSAEASRYEVHSRISPDRERVSVWVERAVAGRDRKVASYYLGTRKGWKRLRSPHTGDGELEVTVTTSHRVV